MPDVLRCPQCRRRIEFVRSRRCPHCGSSLRDEDSPPRPRRASDERERQRRNLILVLGAAGLALVFIVVVGVTMLLWPEKSRPAPRAVGRAAPAGFSEVIDHDGGYAVFFPGDIQRQRTVTHREAGGPVEGYWWNHRWPFDRDHERPIGYVKIVDLPREAVVGGHPDELFELSKRYDQTFAVGDASMHDVVKKQTITLDGKPGLEVWFQDKFRLLGEPGDERWKKHNEDAQANFEKNGTRGVYFIASDKDKLVFIRIELKGKFPDKNMLDTVRSSFRYLR